MQKKPEIDRSELEAYLESIYQTTVALKKVSELAGGKEKIKEFGYGMPLLIEVEVAGVREQLVLHTVRPDKFGHERRSDRAQNIILDFDTFNRLEQHVPALSLGAFAPGGKLLNLDAADEFFLITRFAPGRLFAEDLKNVVPDAPLSQELRRRVLALAAYLAGIHAEKHSHPSLYPRTVRDLLGHGEGIMGLVDSYPADFEVASPARLRAIEERLVGWRWRLKDRSHRLSKIHGDFHPWNILFQKDNRFVVLDRSRGEWGEPADDVSALSINFLFFALRQSGAYQGVFRVLFDLFWEEYMRLTKDVELARVIQPFFVWRALVLAHPVWYPNLSEAVRERLFVWIENMLEEQWFDPEKMNLYLERRTA